MEAAEEKEEKKNDRGKNTQKPQGFQLFLEPNSLGKSIAPEYLWTLK